MSQSLEALKQKLIVHAMMAGVLRFGEFKYKSGRMGPYFFNAGDICDGEGLNLVADAYAAMIAESGIKYDVLFGAAYKGISLAALTVDALYRNHGINAKFAYNRKEAKDHGEGGSLVGADIKGQRVLVIDDVMTAGTAMREVVAIIRANGDEKTSIVGLALMFDRQEWGTNQSLTAVEEISREYSVPVLSLLTLASVVHFIETYDIASEANCDFVAKVVDARTRLPAIADYLKTYGPKTDQKE